MEDEHGIPIKAIRDELVSIHSLLEFTDESLTSETAIEAAEKKSSSQKGLVYADADRNAVHCFKCDSTLFVLRSNCELCPTFERLEELDGKLNKATEEGKKEEILATRVQSRAIAQRVCLPCAMQKYRNNPRGTTRHLQRFFLKENGPE
jgi:hypothetical protein